MSNKMKNYGMLLMDYFNGDSCAQQIMERDDGKVIKIPISVYFRNFEELLPVEKNFLKYCKGDILCVGAGTGIHSLIMQENQFDVLALDISEEACKIMKKRGVKKVKCIDFNIFKGETFDTVVLLGRNIGMVGTLDKLEGFLLQLKSCLKEKGHILLDSFDLKYSQDETDINYMKMNEKSNRYYGEVSYRMIYNEARGEMFNWLYIDFSTLRNFAAKVNLVCEMLEKDEEGNYLARLKMV